MSKFAITLLALTAVIVMSFDALAQQRCKPGYVYDAGKKMCVSTRGSW